VATWYVRPNTNHSGTRNGTSYATAWGGQAEIVYGAGGFTGGDTLYVCGTHTLSAIFRLYNCAGTAEARTYLRGDYPSDPGVMQFVNGTYFLQPEVAYCTIKGLTIRAGNNNCIFTISAANNCIYEDNVLTANNKAAFSFYGDNGQNHTDVIIRRNTFYGESLESAGLGAGIAWFVSTTLAVSTVTRVTIENNVFDGYKAGRSVIHFRTEDDTSTSTKMVDVKCNDNTFKDCKGILVEFRHGHAQKSVGAGVECLRNTITDCTESPITAGVGGAFSIQGFGASTTAGFGPNRIAENNIKNVEGAAGAFNVFYGGYIIEDNIVDGLTTTTIDGNGLLFDHGADGCVARRNQFKNIYGKTGVFNSGYGVMFLDSVNCDVYGNVFENVQYGVHAAGADTFTMAQQFKCHNNTFTGVKVGGCYIGTTADKSQAVVKNNVFVGDTGSAQVICPTTGGWTEENYNNFSGFTVANTNHTLGAEDITSNPQLNEFQRPTSSSPLIAAGAYLGNLQDKNRTTYWNSPSIGAYEYIRPRTMRS
jgi:hypothetical protein